MKRIVHCICVLVLLAALLGSFRAVPVLSAPNTFTVNTVVDSYDSNPGDGVCDDGMIGCSLRAAIEEAFWISHSGNPVTVNFAAELTGPITLKLGPIDWVADYVTLEGGFYTMISGAGLATGQAIFRISGSHNTLTGLAIRDSPYDAVQMGDFSGTGSGNYNTVFQSLLLGNGEAGVWVHGSSSGGGQHNSISQVGIGSTSPELSGCVVGESNGGDGIYIDGPAYATSITSSSINCNTVNGINIYGGEGSPTGTIIEENYIGLNWEGAMPNGMHGIYEQQGTDTVILSNAISGNAQDGVQLSNSTGAILHDNYIGAHYTGTNSLPNGGSGVEIADGSSEITIGGNTSLSERNVISGNSGCGVTFSNGATYNLVDYNLIGLDRTGMNALPNGEAGICIVDSNTNFIGSSMVGVNQYISGNTGDGIYIENSRETFIGQTNRIGVAIDDITRRGNGMDGIFIKDASNNTVYPSILSYNTWAGVAVVGDASTGNRIIPEHVLGNGYLPIDLGNDGVTPNGSQTPPGPNDWQNYPVITSAGGSPVTLQGTTCNGCIVVVYQAIGNTAANGGGGDYLGETTANGSGAWSYILPRGLGRGQVSLLAVNPLDQWTGNSSELSPASCYWQYLPLIRR
jgi:CSLREA domain-containing protein